MLPLRLSRTALAYGAVLASLLAATGCSDSDECPEGGCGDPEAIGVPTRPVCGGDTCTQGVTCSEVIEVDDDAGLADAASQAGACVALAPGSYGDVTLAAGTSMLGRWADEVTVGRVTVDGGTLRGVQASGISVHGTTRIDQVRVSAPTERGIDVQAGANATIVQTEVNDATQHAIVSIDATVTPPSPIARPPPRARSGPPVSRPRAAPPAQASQAGTDPTPARPRPGARRCRGIGSTTATGDAPRRGTHRSPRARGRRRVRARPPGARHEGAHRRRHPAYRLLPP